MEMNAIDAMLRSLPQSPGLRIETPERITLTYFLHEGLLEVDFPDGTRAQQKMGELAAANTIARLRAEGTLQITDDQVDAFLRGVDDTLDAGIELIRKIRVRQAQ